MSTFHEQLKTLLPKLRRFCYSLTANIADGDDLMQHTIERVLSKQSDYDETKTLDNWTLKIAKNAWIDELRKRKPRLNDTELSEQVAASDKDVSTQVVEQELISRVLLVMAELPENQRLVAYYVLVEGYSYKEVSAELSMPIGTVMSSLARARAKLAELVAGGNKND